MTAQPELPVLAYPLVIVGAALIGLAAVGLIRMPDVYNRTNAVAKASSLGLVLLLLGMLAWLPRLPDGLTLLVAVALHLLTATISGFAIGRAAHRSGAPMIEATHVNELDDPPAPGADGTGGPGATGGTGDTGEESEHRHPR